MSGSGVASDGFGRQIASGGFGRQIASDGFGRQIASGGFGQQIASDGLRVVSRGMVTLSAYAKVNLSLDIVGRREDGYHEIVTVMQSVSLCDTVTVSLGPVGGIKITCDNPDIPVDGRNIVYKATEVYTKCLAESGGSIGGVTVDIQKRIPVMAGLGGSSTDGAAVLRGLNVLNGNLFDTDALMRMGASIGADVPFCIVGGRAECRGIGDIVTPVTDSADAEYYAIVKPPFGCCTKNGYERFDRYGRGKNYSKANIFQDLYNDERIDRLCESLLEKGAVTASMTGSGSAVFGVFGNETAARSASDVFGEGYFTCVCANQGRNNV